VEKELHLSRFDLVIGYFITQPMFFLIDWFCHLTR
jgi:hypothetical protein